MKGIKTRENCAISDLTGHLFALSSLYNFVLIKAVIYSFVFNEFQFSSRVRCTYKASFTPRRVWEPLRPPCDFLSRFGLTPGLWTVYTRINVHTRTCTYPRTVDALARGYAHTPTSVEPRFTHPRVHYARYRASIPTRYHYATGIATHRYSWWRRRSMREPILRNAKAWSRNTYISLLK